MHLVECDLKLTEDKKKLTADLKMFFPDADFKEKEDVLSGKTSLKRLKELSEQQGASLIMQLLDKEKIIKLDKVAMHAGIIALDEKGPLGCVAVKE